MSNTEENWILTQEKAFKAIEEYTQRERNERAPGFLGKLIASFDKRFQDRKVSIVIEVEEGDRDRFFIFDYKRPAFDFIEFFCTMNDTN